MYEHEKIAVTISNIRLILRGAGLKLPDNMDILKAFEELAVYVIRNFDIPASHELYICEHLELTRTSNSLVLINELKAKHLNITSNFGIELQLRGIECVFSYATSTDYELERVEITRYLIAKLHALVGDKVLRYKLEPLTV